MKKEVILKTKSFAFAVRVTRLYKYIQENKQEYILNKQLLRSGTAIGALVREAQNAESTADFIHKLRIVLKELRESRCWLRLIYQANLLPEHRLSDLLEECNQLCNIIGQSIATAKNKQRERP